MTTKFRLRLGRVLRSESGQVLPLMAALMIGFLGMAAIVMDVGDVYYSYHELQASTNAAAMAAAEALPVSGADALQNAADYSSQSGSKNDFGNLTVINFTPHLGCVSTGVGASTPCTSTGLASGVQKANAVQVTQTARVPLYFAALFGHRYMDITATGTALMKGSGSPFNIALILDMTGSMNTADTNCGKNTTRLQCALNGIQVFLANISACPTDGCQGTANNSSNYSNAYDRVSLFTFPNGQMNAMSNDYNCSGLPADELKPVAGQTITDYSNAVPYTFPSIGGGAGTIAYYVTTTTTKNGKTTTNTTTYPVTYQVTNGLGDANGFLSNYQGDDGGLNTGSYLVTAMGGKSGCSSMQAPYVDGTYYAGVIYQAQAALAAEQAANPMSENAMIILGDGDSNVSQSYITSYNSMVTTSSQTNGLLPSASPKSSNNYYPSWNNDCGQAILAAQYAKAMGTTVYTVAYGASTVGASGSGKKGGGTAGCSTDTTGVSLGTENMTGQATGLSGTSKNISPCTTMQYMASSSADFYSDYQATGGDSGCQATATGSFTDLGSIFKALASSLSVSRLIPNSTFPTS